MPFFQVKTHHIKYRCGKESPINIFGGQKVLSWMMSQKLIAQNHIMEYAHAPAFRRSKYICTHMPSTNQLPAWRELIDLFRMTFPLLLSKFKHSSSSSWHCVDAKPWLASYRHLWLHLDARFDRRPMRLKNQLCIYLPEVSSYQNLESKRVMMMLQVYISARMIREKVC